MGNVEFTIINIGTLSMNKYWHETERVRTPSATCTLLETSGKRLMVDPSPEPALLEQLLFERAGLKKSEVDQIYLTHYHKDHRFGLDLFAGKPWLIASAGFGEWAQRFPEDKELMRRFSPAEENLPEGVSLYPSPGHTYGHHSLIADTAWGKLIVAGDAVMTRDFYEAEDGFHNSVDFGQVKETIRKIHAEADLVIPGHGNVILDLKKRG